MKLRHLEMFHETEHATNERAMKGIPNDTSTNVTNKSHLHQHLQFISELDLCALTDAYFPSLPCKSDRASLRLITCLQSLQVTDDPQTQPCSCDSNLVEAQGWAWQPDMARHEKSNLWMQIMWGLALAKNVGPRPLGGCLLKAQQTSGTTLDTSSAI